MPYACRRGRQGTRRFPVCRREIPPCGCCLWGSLASRTLRVPTDSEWILGKCPRDHHICLCCFFRWRQSKSHQYTNQNLENTHIAKSSKVSPENRSKRPEAPQGAPWTFPGHSERTLCVCNASWLLLEEPLGPPGEPPRRLQGPPDKFKDTPGTQRDPPGSLKRL